MKHIYQLLGISKQAYYSRKKKQRREANEEALICKKVRAIRRLMPRIGTRKLYHMTRQDLSRAGIKIGRDKFFRILRKHYLLVPRRRKYRRTTQSKHQYFKYPNLLKDMTINRSEQVWVADITYIRTTNGFRYLHLITDAYSKQIMGYELSENMKIETSLKALKMAIKNRRYDLPLIHHSDRGLQYCHNRYTDTLRENGIEVSMTTKYDPYENTIAERMNGILKEEFDIGDGFIDHLQAVDWIKESVEIYNTIRPHLSCGLLTPVQAHTSDKPLQKCW